MAFPELNRCESGGIWKLKVYYRPVLSLATTRRLPHEFPQFPVAHWYGELQAAFAKTGDFVALRVQQGSRCVRGPVSSVQP